MWWFAAGIFMQDLSGVDDSLMLTGVFTFALSGSVVVFGAAVGRWVDNTARLKGKLSTYIHTYIRWFLQFQSALLKKYGTR
jgi:hypothetical protein